MSDLIPVYKTPADVEVGDDGLPLVAETVIARIKGAKYVQTSRFGATGQRTRAIGEMQNRRSITIKNEGANDVFIGGEDLSIQNGYRLGVGNAITLELAGELYAITAGTTELLYMISEVDGE